MANNRMWLRCKCGEEFLLAKYYPTITDGWFVPARYEVQPDITGVTELEREGIRTPLDLTLGDWLEAHSHNSRHTMYDGGRFSLRYEEDDPS